MITILNIIVHLKNKYLLNFYNFAINLKNEIEHLIVHQFKILTYRRLVYLFNLILYVRSTHNRLLEEASVIF